MKNKKNIFYDVFVLSSILIPLIIAIILIYYIYDDSVEYTIAGHDEKTYIMNWFKFPLFVATLMFPLGALAVSNFRAKQMHLNIKTSEAQNTFNNYYKHVEEFEKVLEKLEDRFDIDFYDKLGLYSSLFPENSPENLLLKGNKLFIEKNSNLFFEGINDYNSNFKDLHEIENFYNKNLSFCNLLDVLNNLEEEVLKFKNNNPIEIEIDDLKSPPFSITYNLNPINLEVTTNEIELINQVFNDLCRFSFIEYKDVLGYYDTLFPKVKIDTAFKFVIPKLRIN
ncbi:hypothetical protein [Aureivirga marina]|uniref:hypothetical protein n=1 Tax=Aureivirga marina TaxID=1182451 RepID=UPI0018CA96C6|nr:hypothetical protein [Aureivirga marina]